MNVKAVDDDVAAERANTTVGADAVLIALRNGYPSLIAGSMSHVLVKSQPVYVDWVFSSDDVLPTELHTVDVDAPIVLSQYTPEQVVGYELYMDPMKARLVEVEYEFDTP